MAASDGKTTRKPKIASAAASKPKAAKGPAPKAATSKSAPKDRVEAAAAATEPPRPSVSPDAAAFADPAAFLSSQQREALEKLSANLARAAVTAQGAIAEAALRQADSPAALSPDPFHVAPALTDVMGRLASQPDRLLRAQADLFSRYLDL